MLSGHMLPCADVHWKLLPAISRELARSMEKEGLRHTQIASTLGTTSSAISQYISGKRGGMKLEGKAVEACKKLAKSIAKGKMKGKRIDSEIARILVIAKKSNLGKNDPCAICMASPAHSHS